MTYAVPSRSPKPPNRTDQPWELDRFTAEVLRGLVQQQGYASAIETFYRAVAAAPPHAAFIRHVDSLANDLALAKCELNRLRILIVPGALYREYPVTGADGKRFVQIIQELGVPCDTIPIHSFGPCEENGRIITEWLASHPPAAGEQQVLVSFSKGSADIKTALLDPNNHAHFRALHGWLSVGGIFHGTPLIEWLQRHWIRHFFVRLWLRRRRWDPQSLLQLAHGPGTPLDTPTILPQGLPLVHLVAFPTPDDLGIPLAHRAFNRLLPRGPNDGGGLLLADLPRFSGILYPVRGTDHYMRNRPDLPALLLRVLRTMMSSP